MNELLMRWHRRPFSWRHDCCRFVGECIAAVHGYNPMDMLYYRGEAGATALLERHGGLQGVMQLVLGDPIDDDIRNGDVTLHDYNGKLLPGFVWGGRCLVRTATGIMDWPLEWAQLWWRPAPCRR